MSVHGFDFLSYGKSIEKLMSTWYAYTQEAVKQSSDLGFAREHFIKQILEGLLPRSVIIGSGEIVDGYGGRSGQQDIIIYRSDFPVITSLTPINTYLVEGVIATIEVKSNISTGSPNHLCKAFENIKRVLQLHKRAYPVNGDETQIAQLMLVGSIKTYVVGYSGWQTQETFFDNCIKALECSGEFPHLICQPNFCAARDDGILGVQPVEYQDGMGALVNEGSSMAVFLQHLLKTIVFNTSGARVTAQGVEAEMRYDLSPYFSFDPPINFERYRILGYKIGG
jgi:hypothetical protein